MSKVIYIKKVFKDTKENLDKDTVAYERGLMFYCKDDGSIKVADGERPYSELPYLIKSSGGGTSNYEELANLPKINGITLIGNKTAEDLGINIPTKLSDLIDDQGFITIDELSQSQEAQTEMLQGEINLKADAGDVYTKDEVDSKIKITYTDLDSNESSILG